MPREDLIQLRRGTAAEWNDANPTLALAEPGLVTDGAGELRLGDGVNAWTALPDAARYLPLEALDARRSAGTATFSGDGAATSFTIPHGLGAVPPVRDVTPESAAAGADHHISADATNIVVTYAAAPAAGTNNVVLGYHAEL